MRNSRRWGCDNAQAEASTPQRGQMIVQHGELRFQTEDTWLDVSQVYFVEPADDSLAKEMAKRASASGANVQRLNLPAKARANFALSTRPITVPEELRKQFAESELRGIVARISNLKLGEIQAVTVAGQPGASLELEMQHEGMAAKQIHALAVVGDRLVHFCGTAALGEFEKLRPTFLKTLSSLELVR